MADCRIASTLQQFVALPLVAHSTSRHERHGRQRGRARVRDVSTRSSSVSTSGSSCIGELNEEGGGEWDDVKCRRQGSHVVFRGMNTIHEVRVLTRDTCVPIYSCGDFSTLQLALLRWRRCVFLLGSNARNTYRGRAASRAVDITNR